LPKYYKYVIWRNADENRTNMPGANQGERWMIRNNWKQILAQYIQRLVLPAEMPYAAARTSSGGRGFN